MRALSVKSRLHLWSRSVCILLVVLFVVAGLGVGNAEAEVKSKKHVAKSTEQTLYAINIASLPEPFDRTLLPRDRALKKFSIYTVKVRSKGKDWRGVRVGFFTTRAEAKKALRALPKKYKGAWIVKVSESEKRSANKEAKQLRGSVGSKVKGLAGLVSGIFSGKKSAEIEQGAKKSIKEKAKTLYAINIASYPEPFDKSMLPKKQTFKGHQLYTVKTKSKGKAWTGLRVGFFTTKKEADKALGSLPKQYRGAWVIKVSERERELAEAKAPGAVKRVGSEFDHFRTGFPLTGAHERIRCEVCHGRGLFKGTPTQCIACHSPGGRVAAPGKSRNHIRTEAPCDQCHLTATWGSVRFDHGSVGGQCSTCHDNRIATGKSVTHFASTNNCDDCHRTSTWSSARFDHFAVTGQCINCHNGSSATGKTPTHVASSNVCDECHGTNSWHTARFDHSSVAGQCSNCHNGSTATGKTGTHITSSNVCDECHSTNAWIPTSFDHSATSGQCSNCHNGSSATGKPGTHIASSNVCDECHSTNGWIPASFDHASASGQCSNCHNGSTATGKPGTHITSSNICDECHTTNAWTPAGFNHDSVSGQCSNCHNGSTATGKPGAHITSSNICDECHSTNAWIPASFDHASASNQCTSCHNGSIATGKTGSHFVTTMQCSECHSTNSWVPTRRYSHTSGAYPGDHNSGVVCLNCHQSNTQTATWTSGAYRPDCAGCHASDYEAREHKKVDSPRLYYTVGELRDCAGSCHRYTDSSLTTIERTRNSKHDANDGGF